MGLDWIPLGRPKPGMERDFLSALGALTSTDGGPNGTGLPFGSGGDAADAWIRERRATARDEPPTAEEGVKGSQGFYVLDLLPNGDGPPVHSDAGWGGTERFTFRGEFLDDCRG